MMKNYTSNWIKKQMSNNVIEAGIHQYEIGTQAMLPL